jgi:hypothetical protein
MIFPAPIFLYLLPLAGLPVVFHFILKQKKRTVVFSTLMFFRRTDPKLNSHRKIRQWLLLLMRMLLIAFILLALSRPEFVTSMGLGGKVSMVAVVDNSASMSGGSKYDSDKSKLEYAREGARKLLLSLDGDSRAAVLVSVDEPAIEKADSLSSDTESLLETLDRIRPTAARGDAVYTLTRAFDLLGETTAGGGAVHVFSDMQQNEWERDLAKVKAGGAPLKVYFHKVESAKREGANVAITAVQFPEEKVLPKHPCAIGLVLHNNSEKAANVRVNSIDNQDHKSTENVVLEQGRAVTFEVETTPEQAGYHWVKAWLEGDVFSADNEACMGVFCEETATVLFGGEAGEFGVLPVALSPSGEGQFTGMVVSFSSQEQLGRAAVRERPILIVTTWDGIQAASSDSEWMRNYVESGGNLLVVPSVMPGRMTLSGKYADWLGASVKAREMYARGVGLEVLNETNNFWNRIRETTGNSKLETVSAYAFYPLALSGEFEPLLGVDFERVVIARKKMGKGNIFLSGTAFASRWNTLPSSGLSVMIAQRMAVTGTSSGQEGVLSLVAGERPRGVNAQGGEVEILSLVGDSMNWRGREQEIPAFARTGVYVLTAGDKKYCISVRASETEGVERFVEGSEVAALGQIENAILPFDEDEDFGQYHSEQAKSVELFLPFLLLATLALLAEGWLGAPRASKAGREQSAGRAPETGENHEGRLRSEINSLSRRIRKVAGRSTGDETAERRAS